MNRKTTTRKKKVAKKKTVAKKAVKAMDEIKDLAPTVEDEVKRQSAEIEECFMDEPALPKYIRAAAHHAVMVGEYLRQAAREVCFIEGKEGPMIDRFAENMGFYWAAFTPLKQAEWKENDAKDCARALQDGRGLIFRGQQARDPNFIGGRRTPEAEYAWEKQMQSFTEQQGIWETFSNEVVDAALDFDPNLAPVFGRRANMNVSTNAGPSVADAFAEKLLHTKEQKPAVEEEAADDEVEIDPSQAKKLLGGLMQLLQPKAPDVD